MTTQQTMFGTDHLARATDSSSSRRAVEAIAASGVLRGQRLAVFEAVREHPGLTSKELAAAAGLDRYVVARRLPDLGKAGLVERREIGGSDVRWWIT